MQFIVQTIIDKIKEYNKISLFFHELPDFDALGACFALKVYLQYKHPEKEVKIIGLDVLEEQFSLGFFEFSNDHIPNSFLAESLGIILDTSVQSRIWTGRHKFCKELIRIDHHPQVESIGQYEWIDDEYPATCQMVGELLFDWDASCITKIIAMYLYGGLLTDTNRFLYPTTKPSTFELASKLFTIDFNKNKLYDIIYLKTLKEAKFDSYIMSLVKFDSNSSFAYAVIPKNAFKKFDIGLRMSMVHVLNNIKNIQIWMTIYYDETIHRWCGSLRSRQYAINQIASKYNGGGHKLASGFQLNKFKDYKKIIIDIKEYLDNIFKISK